MKIGAHVGMNHSLRVGKELNADIVQIHLGSPRQWNQTKLPKGEVFPHVYVHAPYLINFSAIHTDNVQSSIVLLRRQVVASEELGALGLVIHGGSWKKSTQSKAMKQWSASLSSGFPVPVLVENAANGKFSLTRYAEDFIRLMDYLRAGSRSDIGWCLDTAHIWAATHKPDSELGRLFTELGPPNLVHANGSSAGVGTGKDRHSPLLSSLAPADWIWDVIVDSGCQDVIVESTDPMEDIQYLKLRRMEYATTR